MRKALFTAHLLHWALMILLITSVVGFLSFTNTYGLFLASITAFIAYGVCKNKRWAYFSTAVWGLACYQLAKQGYEFQELKHVVMALGAVVIPAAVFVHEILGKQKNVNAQKSVINAVPRDDLPQ